MQSSYFQQRLGQKVLLHGTLGRMIEEFQPDDVQLSPDTSPNGTVLPFAVSLLSTDPQIPESESRIRILFQREKRDKIESFLGQSVVVECQIIGIRGQGIFSKNDPQEAVFKRHPYASLIGIGPAT